MLVPDRSEVAVHAIRRPVTLLAAAVLATGGCGSGSDGGGELERTLVDQGADEAYARCLDDQLGAIDVDDVARLVDANSHGGYPALVDDVAPDTLDAFLDANRTCTTADG